MDFLKLVRARYSVRQYQNRPVEPEKVEQLLEAAQAAPTAANCQPVRLLVVETPDGRRRLAGAAELYGAPLAVVVCADRSRAWKRPFDGKQTTDIDASILTDHMMLAASALGLGSVWICYFQPEAVKAALGLPEHLEPVNILAVGYADGAPASPERLDPAFIRWIWDFHRTQRPRVLELLDGWKGEAHIFRSPAQCAAFLAQQKNQNTPGME